MLVDDHVDNAQRDAQRAVENAEAEKKALARAAEEEKEALAREADLLRREVDLLRRLREREAAVAKMLEHRVGHNVVEVGTNLTAFDPAEHKAAVVL